MRRTFNILEDFLFLGIFIVVAALVTVAVFTGDDAYPLVSATTVVASAADRGVSSRDLEAGPALAAQNIAATPGVTPPVATAAPMTATGDAAASR